jgi:uncharacterized repeat protein (TIGR03803 family)
MIPDGTVSVLHVFIGGTTDGVYPQAALIQATDGNFYRTTTAGGTSDAGTVFKMTPADAVTVLHDFSVETDAVPQAPPIQATDGNLYGTMYGRPGGPCGTAFKITASGVLTVLYGFTCDNNGGFPAAPLVRATDGNLYGTTSWDGARTGGTIFKLIPGGTLTVLHAFTDADGHQSYAPYGPEIRLSCCHDRVRRARRESMAAATRMTPCGSLIFWALNGSGFASVPVSPCRFGRLGQPAATRGDRLSPG